MSSTVEELTKMAATHLAALEASEAGDGEEMPADALNSLAELGKLATQIQVLRRRGESQEGRQGRQHSVDIPCEKFNTWWNSTKYLLGMCDEWGACMKARFGCDGASVATHNCCPD